VPEDLGMVPSAKGLGSGWTTRTQVLRLMRILMSLYSIDVSLRTWRRGGIIGKDEYLRWTGLADAGYEIR
jgi:hypothetical protein